MFNEDLSAFFDVDEFAEKATYNGVEIDVVEDVSGDAGFTSTGDPGFVIPLFQVLIKADDVSRPGSGDPVTFRGRKCRVDGNPRSEGGLWRVNLIERTLQV